MSKVPGEIKEGEIKSEHRKNTRVNNFFKKYKRNPRNNDFVSFRV
jgi:hypothetical protein